MKTILTHTGVPSSSLLLAACTCFAMVLPSYAVPPLQPCHLARIEQNVPDPDILFANGAYYLYVTNSELGNVPVLHSDNLSSFRYIGDALPELPSWAKPHFTWAPEVTYYPATESYVLYFTARHGAVQCIGTATGKSPEGPFNPLPGPPLICPIAEGGAIDASSFEDADGRKYLLWKNDGNCCGIDTWISIQELSSDGLRLWGTKTQLLRQDQTWEGNVIEAPTLWLQNGAYVLFYSGNRYDESYAMGYAMARDLLGPYTKGQAPLLASSPAAGVIGPGGQDVVRRSDGSTLIIYHSWSADMSYRGIKVDELNWADGVPNVTTACQSQ